MNHRQQHRHKDNLEVFLMDRGCNITRSAIEMPNPANTDRRTDATMPSNSRSEYPITTTSRNNGNTRVGTRIPVRRGEERLRIVATNLLAKRAPTYAATQLVLHPFVCQCAAKLTQRLPERLAD